MVKNQPQKTCIIILGMHRSGTSALTRLVNICGASLPNTLLNATKGNKTGHWESQKIVDMHDQFLSKVGSSWNDCSKLDLEAISTSIQTDYIDDLASLLNSEYNDSSLIVLKDPRICRFLPLTLKAITAANFIPKIIHIIRNPIEVSKSLTTRDGLTEETGHLLWLRHNIDAEKHSRNMAYTSLTYDNLLKNWKECLDNIQTSLKLFNRDSLSSIAPQINEFLSPRHRHHTHTLEDTLIDPSLKSWLGLTFETFVNAQRGYLSEKSQSHLDTVNMEFSAATPFIIKMLAKTQAQSKLIETNETVIAQLNNEISRERDTIKSYKKLEAETLKGLAWERSQHEQTQHALKAYEKREAENLKGLAWERSQHEQTQHALKAYEKREAETLKGLAWERSQHEQTQHALKAYEKREAETLKGLAWERSQHEQTQQALKAYEKREAETLKGLAWERSQHEQTQQALKAYDKREAETLKGLAWERSQHEQTQQALKAYEKREAETLKGLAWERSQHEQTQQALKAYDKREAETLKGLAWERSQHEQTQQALKAYEKREAETLKELAWERSQHEQTLQTFHKRETEILKARSSERKQHEHTQQSFEKSLNTLSMKFDKQVAETEFKTSQIEAMYASNSWKLGAPLRALKRAWSNKTRLLVALLAGGSARALLQNSNDLQLAAEQSRSSAILNSRIALQKNRQNTPDASWLKSYLNRGILVQDKDLPNVTISVVLYNSEQWLWNFFMSVEALHYPMAKIAIHFIDNGSSDKTIEAVNTFIEKNKHRYNKLKITERPNLGYGMGNDFAIRDAETDFVLVTNVDIEFYPDCLRNLVAVAISDDEKVACWETRQTPYEHPKYYDPVTLESNWSAHAAVLLRRSAYLDVGGYDPNIFMYGEDVELSYRFRAKGWKLRYVPIATIYHHVELDNSDVRPHQLSGSSAANILLRYRYGTYRDILAGEAFFYAVKRNETNPLRAEAWEKVEKILRKNRWYFFKSRIRTNGKIHFPFNEFDYDITRPGEAVIREPFKPSEAKNLPLVSIITRTHGPADIHLRNVISNVLTQTYPNIEHIIVEDKTDFAKDYVAKMSDTYGDRIKYLKSPGQGRSECGNHGAKHAKGQYLCWLDNDDLLFADHIETLIRGLDDDASAVCSYALAWDAFVNEADGEPYAEKFELPLSHKQDYDQARFNTENFIPIQAIVFRKSLFNQYGGFNADFSQLEDWNLWARYSEVGKFIYTPKVTSVYFTPSDSEKRNERHQVLHAAYDSVKKANIADMLEIRQSLSTQIAG